MKSLDKLNDQQNHLLTQLSYQSHRLTQFRGLTLNEIYDTVSKSNKKADRELEKCLKQMLDADLGGLRIKDAETDGATGFGAVAFTDAYGNTGISYRGTDGPPSAESWNDWLDNVVAAVNGTSIQCAQAEAFFNRNKDIDRMNYLYGHSKGGNLSESVYVNNYTDIKAVHLLNPQPLNPYSLSPDQRIAMQSDKIDIVIVEGDPVWCLGNLPSYYNIRVMKNPEGADAHRYNPDRYTNGNINPGQFSTRDILKYCGITILMTGFQIAGGAIGFAYNCVVRVLDFAREEVWPKIKEFIDTTTKWISDTYNDLKDFAVQLGNFLVDVGKAAVKWCKENLNKGYKYAMNNTFIQIDTAAYRDLASRLSSVNKRITKLDSRMNSLYTKVNITDIYDVIKANVMTSYSWNIRCCINYLNDTASDFEEVERSIISQL